MKSKIGNQAGFSIIEILIGLVILSVVMAGFLSVIEYRAKTNEMVGLQQAVEGVEPILRTRLAHKYLAAVKSNCAKVKVGTLASGLYEDSWQSSAYVKKQFEGYKNVPAHVASSISRCNNGTKEQGNARGRFCLSLSNESYSSSKVLVEVDLAIIDLETQNQVNCAQLAITKTATARVRYVISGIADRSRGTLYDQFASTAFVSAGE